jgi:hypothetical protein
MLARAMQGPAVATRFLVCRCILHDKTETKWGLCLLVACLIVGPVERGGGAMKEWRQATEGKRQHG